jgi:hypothetical protein
VGGRDQLQAIAVSEFTDLHGHVNNSRAKASLINKDQAFFELTQRKTDRISEEFSYFVAIYSAR